MNTTQKKQEFLGVGLVNFDKKTKKKKQQLQQYATPKTLPMDLDYKSSDPDTTLKWNMVEKLCVNDKDDDNDDEWIKVPCYTNVAKIGFARNPFLETEKQKAYALLQIERGVWTRHDRWCNKAQFQELVKGHSQK